MHSVLEGNLKEGKPREEKEGKRMAPVLRSSDTMLQP